MGKFKKTAEQRQANAAYQRKWRENHPDYEKMRSKTPKRIAWRRKIVESGKSAEYSRKYHQSVKGRAANQGYLARMAREMPLQIAARWKVRNAINAGKLIKPNRCSQCQKVSNRIHAHHFDYTRPLDVTWLCHWCHTALHLNASQQADREISTPFPRGHEPGFD